MQTMTDEKRKLEIGDVEKLIAKIPEPKEKECYWHQLFEENPQSMQQGAIEDFIRQYGCESCKGYKALCRGRA